MIPKECKRLAEVDFPLASVSKAALAESASHGNHPKGLHLWWARRPLSACRAILLALVLPDPLDPLCPSDIRNSMRQVLLSTPARPERWKACSKTSEGLRQIALEFIAEFSKSENAQNSIYIRSAQQLVRIVFPEGRPLVLDTFAGGGSIPLEALRLGCDGIGSDLNPVACLILRSELEILPRKGEDLIDEFNEAGRIIDGRYRARIQEFFSSNENGDNVICYFWARQATCESPHCGVKFPLASDFWLCKKKNRKTALTMSTKSNKDCIEWNVFHPIHDSDVPYATASNGRARCPKCGTVLTSDRLRYQLHQHNGGIEEAKLLAVVKQEAATGMKSYNTASLHDVENAEKAALYMQQIIKEINNSALSPIPNEPIPHSELRRLSAPLYGCKTWQDLFLPRQRLSLFLLMEEIKRYIKETNKIDLLPLLVLAFGKVVRHWNSNARWHTKSEAVAGAFGRQAIPMTYFFPEQSPLLSSGSGSWLDAVKSVSSSSRAIVNIGNIGQSFRADASDVPLPSGSVAVWFTDPPYYDAVAYGHLADFFYVWFRRLLHNDQLFGTGLIDKTEECVVDRPHSRSPLQKRADWFEKKMTLSMAEARRMLAEDGIASVVFAHKTTEGWEAIIGGMLKAGWVITASWPISTERGARLNARDNASLATSVHLICRPRADNAPIGDWADVLRELPNRVGYWMERLQSEGIRGADLVFACIGPALEIFSRYRRVETPDGQEVTLAEYLVKVWEVVGRIALEQILGTAEARARNGMAGALEEDARLTALFLWTLQSTNGAEEGKSKKAKGKKEETDDSDLDENENDDDESPKGKTKGYSLVFDVVRRFAQPLGINLPKWEDRIIETTKGVVRLMAVSERTKQIFGASGIETAIEELLAPTSDGQMTLPGFQELVAQKKQKTVGRGKKIIIEDPGEINTSATTLDRVHAAMLLQASGQANALRMLIKAEQDRGPDFLRLANALSALYPVNSEEKRLLDAMLLAVPR